MNDPAISADASPSEVIVADQAAAFEDFFRESKADLVAIETDVRHDGERPLEPWVVFACDDYATYLLTLLQIDPRRFLDEVQCGAYQRADYLGKARRDGQP